MSDFSEAWSLTRARFLKAYEGVTTEQLNWRLHPDTLTLGEMALHVAGVELSFGSQLLGETLEGLPARIKQAATDGSLNDKPFPFAPEEITPELVSEALEIARAKVEPMITNPDPYRDGSIISAFGPTITGTGAFARLAYHAGYHHGQAYFIQTAPGFPQA